MLKLNRGKIVLLLMEKRLTQSDLARRVGVSRQRISQIVNGDSNSHSLKLISKIAAALDVPGMSLIQRKKG